MRRIILALGIVTLMSCNKKVIVINQQTAMQYGIGDEWCTNDLTTW